MQRGQSFSVDRCVPSCKMTSESSLFTKVPVRDLATVGILQMLRILVAFVVWCVDVARRKDKRDY